MNQDLYTYTLRQADNCMVLCQRLCEWNSKAPELEEDIALTNMGLDLIGQARSLYQYAAQLENKGRTEDDLAFMRDERDWVNCLLVEHPNGNFADTMARQFFFDAWHLLFLSELQNSKDSTLAAIAAKSVKEARYHLRHSANWVLRLGDGTEQSHAKMQAGIEELWRFTPELFASDELDQGMLSAGIGVDLAKIELQWQQQISALLTQATLKQPENGFAATGGREGLHTESMGYLLAQMQHLPRSMPGCEW